MGRHDFIVEQVEQFAIAIGKILTSLLNLKNQGKVTEGLGITLLNLNFLLNINFEKIILLPDNEFTMFLQDKFNNNIDILRNFSEILYIIAEEYVKDKSNYEICLNYYNKILIINEILHRNNCSSHINKQLIDERIKMIDS